MNQTNIKLAIALVLFVAWVSLVVFNVQNSADLITAIKYALGALGAHTLTMVNPAASIDGTATLISPATTEVTQ